MINEILTSLEQVTGYAPQRTRTGFKALCPAHNDTNPSLSISEGNNGRVLLHCFTGCDYEEIMAALKQPIPGAIPSPKRQLPSKLVATYPYRDVDGRELYCKYRYEPKRFAIAHSNGGGEYEWGMGNAAPVLYRLPELVASDVHAPIFIVEGEKDAEAIAAAGFVATTNFDGAGKWRSDYNRYFSGRTVWIIPDNDDAGRRHAQQVARELHETAFSVKIVELTGLGHKQDVSDWLALGNTAHELYGFCLDAPEWEPPLETSVFTNSNGHVSGLRITSMRALVTKHFEPMEFIVEGLIAKGHLVMLAGRPKSGKSWLVLQLAKCVDTGQKFLERDTRQARVLLVALEDGDRRINQRANLLKWTNVRTAEVTFDVANFDGPDGTPGPGLLQIEEAANQFDLIIIDTLIATLSGRANENDNTEMGAIVNTLARIAHDTNTAIILVHHTGKGISDDVFNTLRGASALRGGYDVGLLLERKQGEKEAILHAESRDVDVENMTIRQVENGEGWEYIGSSAEIKKIRSGRKVVEAILELDPVGDGVTVKKIAEHRGVSESAIYKQIKNPVEEGYIVKIQRPSTEDGKQPDLYYVQEKYR